MKIVAMIRQLIEKVPLGEPFTTSRFLSFGTRANVDQSLSRLVKMGLIERVSRGVYVRPKENRYVGKLIPEPFKVAQTIAASGGAIVQVQGAEAARRFGLTTQVPAQSVFITNGPSRHLRLGNLQVELRHVSLRKLALAGSPAGLALAALWHLGRRGMTPEAISAIHAGLSAGEFEALKSAVTAMPVWMSNAIRQHERSQSHA